MSRLIINNHLIDEPIENILYEVKKEIHNKKLKDIKVNGKDIKVTCPFHKGGQENDADCHINCDENAELPYGYFHCFASSQAKQ